MKPLIYSFSFLDCYHNVCPRQAWEKYVAKTVKYVPQVSADGVDAHKALEDRLKRDVPLPPPLANAEPVCASLKKPGLKLAIEVKMGCTVDWRPAPFFENNDPQSPAPRFRGVPDVNAYAPAAGAAVLVDWKPKAKNNWLQHAINASLVFANYDTVRSITAFNVIYKTGGLGERHSFSRDTLAETHAVIRRLADEIDAAGRSARWPERQGPLCAWCAVEACQFNRNKELKR